MHSPQPGFETVFTVTDYYDGPRQGIANYRGYQHFYDCIFSDQKKDFTCLYHRLGLLKRSLCWLSKIGKSGNAGNTHSKPDRQDWILILRYPKMQFAIGKSKRF